MDNFRTGYFVNASIEHGIFDESYGFGQPIPTLISIRFDERQSIYGQWKAIGQQIVYPDPFVLRVAFTRRGYLERRPCHLMNSDVDSGRIEFWQHAWTTDIGGMENKYDQPSPQGSQFGRMAGVRYRAGFSLVIAHITLFWVARSIPLPGSVSHVPKISGLPVNGVLQASALSANAPDG